MHINATPQSKRLFRLRTILLLLMLSILLLPLGSLYFFRFYENELVQKTELELITQSAAFSAVYRQLINKNHTLLSGNYTPIKPELDLSKQQTLPPRPDGMVLDSPVTENLVAKQAGQKMQTILRNTQQFTLAGIRILDENGIVIAGREEIGLSLAHIEEVQAALKGKYRSVLRERISDQAQPPLASLSRGTGIRVFTAFPIIDQGRVYGVVYLSRTPQNILKHLDGIKGRVFFIALLLLGVTSLIVLFISSRLSRPIRELIDQTKKVTRGEVETINAIQQPGTYELAELSNSFAEMSQIVHERTQYIEQFAAHVSHEFKTPLTSIQGTLELLQDHLDEMPLEQRQHFLDNLQQDTKRLENLVTRLLQQARADALQASTDACNILQVLNQLQAIYKAKQLKLILDDSLDENISVSAEALTLVFVNLFDNSLQHNANKVLIKLSHSDEQLQLSIHDNGTGISPANRSRIFTPFFTTRRDTGGTGLGLGIIESTLKAWNSAIVLKSSEHGAHFIIEFNL